jgi:hypothetical protein
MAIVSNTQQSTDRAAYNANQLHVEISLYRPFYASIERSMLLG